MTSNAKIGGILSIVFGALGIIGCLMFILLGVLMAVMPEWLGDSFGNDPTGEGVFIVMAVMYAVMGVIGALVGALAIVGGVFALKKKHWGWALAGGIASTLVFFPFGVAAIILIAMGKKEFETASAQVTPGMTGTIVG
jgi:MFS family permease